MDIKDGAWPLIFGVLSAVAGLGGLAGIAALINSRATRAKTNAEADKAEAEAANTITEAATKLIEPLQTEVTRLNGRVGQLETSARLQHMLLVEHSVWDHLALARMQDAGLELPPIPPLFHDPSKTPASEAPHA